MKPTVFYQAHSLILHTAGVAFLIPVNHPNGVRGQRVMNDHSARTSLIESFDPATGRVETKNTIYLPEAPHESD